MIHKTAVILAWSVVFLLFVFISGMMTEEYIEKRYWIKSGRTDAALEFYSLQVKRFKDCADKDVTGRACEYEKRASMDASEFSGKEIEGLLK